MKKNKGMQKWVSPVLWGTAVLTSTVVFSKPSFSAKDVQPYQINRGDTLSQIAESLYGNWIKFKDLWEINKDRIADPNLIYPGQRLRLIEGGELELVADDGIAPKNSVESFSTKVSRSGPLLASNSTVYGINKGHVHRPTRTYRSEEWQLLPQQRWEKFVFRKAPEIDPQGFDRRSRVGIRYKNTYTLPGEMVPDRLAVFGTITGGRTEYSYFGLGEHVLIRADEELQVGKIYTVAEEPKRLSSGRDGRTGFLYRYTAKVKIVGVRDGAFVGTLVQVNRPVSRDMIIVQDVDMLKPSQPIGAPSAIGSHIIESENENAINYSDYRFLFVDVGTEDGIKPGMILRRYQHVDPYNSKELSSKDFLVDAEMIVVKSNPRFSVALVLNARAPIKREDELVAVVDVRDLGHHMGLQGSLQDQPTQDVNDLDSIDSTQGIGEQEDRDLQQLEEESTAATDEIQRVDMNPNSRRAVGIGDEVGPNDRSSKPSAVPANPEAPVEGEPLPEPAPGTEEVTPEAIPETAPEPAPETVPETPSGAPAEPGLNPTPPPQDPFSTDSFQEAPPPVTESNPNPSSDALSDPLLEAIPEPTPATEGDTPTGF